MPERTHIAHFTICFAFQTTLHKILELVFQDERTTVLEPVFRKATKSTVKISQLENSYSKTNVSPSLNRNVEHFPP